MFVNEEFQLFLSLHIITRDNYKKVKFPVDKKHVSKIFLVAFPVIILATAELFIFFMIGDGRIKVSTGMAFLLVFILTLVAISGMLYLYNKLVHPLRQAKDALNNYISSQEIPQLPDHIGDEAGLLLSNIHATITQLDALNVEKTDMIDLISHDLRSPVGRIMSLSNLIKTEDGADVGLYSDYIINECKGLLRMLENILLMLKEDNHVFGMVSVNLKKIILDTLTFFDFPIAEKGLKTNIAIDESVYIHVQPDLFTQAVRNILGNAIKFSPDGKTIHITGKEEREKVYLVIEDEGVGLKPEDVGRIFDRFTKAGKRGTRGESSVGLGLYLTRKIIEKHDGQIIADSKGLNKGATFTIVLHRLVTKKPQDKNLSSKAIPGTMETGARKGLHAV